MTAQSGDFCWMVVVVAVVVVAVVVQTPLLMRAGQ